MRYFKYILCLTLTLLLAFPAMASDAGGGKPNASAIVLGHIKDSYEWHVTDIGEKHIIINLPVIVKSSTGWHVFSSAKFTEEADANGYRKGPFNLAIATKGAHAGKIVELNDKGAVVALEDGVEGFCTTRHLQKEDKTPAQKGDTMKFKVIEFNGDAKRILLSHLRTWEERKEAPAKESAKAAKKEAAPEMPKVEKTTLGDLDVLANLKASMEAGK